MKLSLTKVYPYPAAPTEFVSSLHCNGIGEIQREGEARNTMISAMKEVMALSEKAGIRLTDEDFDYWLKIIIKLSPEGKPSMR